MPRSRWFNRRDPSEFRDYVYNIMEQRMRVKFGDQYWRRFWSMPSEVGRVLGTGPIDALREERHTNISPKHAVRIGTALGIDEAVVMQLLFYDPEIKTITDLTRKTKRLNRQAKKHIKAARRTSRAGALVPVVGAFGRRLSDYSRRLGSAVRYGHLTGSERDCLMQMAEESVHRAAAPALRAEAKQREESARLQQPEDERRERVAQLNQKISDLEGAVKALRGTLKYNGHKTRAEWADANDEAYKQFVLAYERIKKARRRARIYCAGGSGYTPAQWYERMREFGYKCAYCGRERDRKRRMGELTLEHVVPMPFGPDDISNIVPACHRCNSSKSDRDLLEWLRGKNVEKLDDRVYEIYRQHKHDTECAFHKPL